MNKGLWVVLCALIDLSACTGILMKGVDGSFVTGRTVEFGVDLDLSVAVVPRNMQFTSHVMGKKGKSYTSKYAVVGAYCFKDQVIMDGMNEKGLVAAAFYFQDYAGYSNIDSTNQEFAVSPVEFPHWILTQFASIEEVLSGLNSVVIAPQIAKDWGSAPAPFHYIVYDRLGKSLVIEPVDGVLVVYENPLGVITNSPGFDWHLQNLINYINIKPQTAMPVEIRGLKLTPFGQGSGGQGMPGDFTPPSRFVRATFFSVNSLVTKTNQELINQSFHVLNQFDIPLGTVSGQVEGKIHYDHTMFTSVKNPNDLKYYYKSYDNQVVKFIDLNKFDLNAKTIVSQRVQGNTTYEDVSNQLK